MKKTSDGKRLGLGWAVSCKCAFVRLLGKLRLLSEKRVRFLSDYVVVEHSPLFDADWYLQDNPDVARAGYDPVWHYCKMGWREGRSPSQAFDAAKYNRLHPECAASGMIPVVHCLMYVESGENAIVTGKYSAVSDIVFPDGARAIQTVALLTP